MLKYAVDAHSEEEVFFRVCILFSDTNSWLARGDYFFFLIHTAVPFAFRSVSAVES